MDYKIRFLRPFKDGNIIPRGFSTNEETTVTARQLEMMKNSGAMVEVLSKVIPPHVPAQAEPEQENLPKSKKKAVP